MSASLERRQFFKIASLLAGGLPALAAGSGAAAAAAGPPAAGPASADGGAPLRWLDGTPASFRGATWGVAWPQGRVQRDSGFELRIGEGAGARAGAAVQSWPLAYWPDGTLKWTAHALPPDAGGGKPAAAYTLHPLPAGAASAPIGAGPLLANESAALITIDNGVLQCTLPRAGALLIKTLQRAGKPLLTDGRLILLVDGAADDEATGAARRAYDSTIDKTTLEQNGPQRAVVRIEGAHRHTDGARLLPYVVRLYFYKDSDAVRVVHTLVYDADPDKAYIRGVGLRFGVPLRAPLHDRHIRFAGDNGGVFAESVRGITGLRRDAGKASYDAQLSGRTVPLDQLSPQVSKGLRYIPAFGQYSLLQSHPDGFSIAKRTSAGHGWVHAASGTRASGTGYVGAPDGGVAFGVRNFWQSYPGQLDIAGAETELATVTLWLWAPKAPAMDLRFYHDGMGEDSFAKQRDALDITYEDYEPGFGTPYGVARTSEIELQLLPATPSNADLVDISRRIQSPPQLMVSGEALHNAGVFSEYWSPAASRPTPAQARLEKQLAWSFDFYRKEIEQRKWYGYWDYGDVMHTYDEQRHVWRYDVGGFAWDNSELSTEIWLWHYFLHSGRADAFRMAEAMTRHTGEVDVHHIGPFSPLGSRHSVQHWGDSAKQLRVSTAINRRFMYYLTADERVGDLLSEQTDAVERLRTVVPGRKVGQKAAEEPGYASVAFGTDWGAVAAAWFTEWERSGKPQYRDKLLASMASIAAQPLGFLAGGGTMDLRTGAYVLDHDKKISVSHLSAVFGLPEICSELIRTVPQPGFRDAWLRYCRLYNASAEQQKAELGQDLGKLNLGQGHARLLAYAAVQWQDKAMLTRAWAQFHEGRAGLKDGDLVSRIVKPPLVLAEVEEAPTLSTNAVAQWGLGALGMLALDAANSALFSDDFQRFDPRSWAVEAEAGDAASAARAASRALMLDAGRGLTVWLRKQLIGHYEITFTRTILAEGRLSDMNFFWEAQLPAGFTQSGKLEEYDKLRLFYAGVGGNSNSTTRFRYYDGSGERKLLQEYTTPDFLLKANHPYRIRIAVDAQGTRLFVDDKLYFSAPGPQAGGGYFGLRTTQSRQKIENFSVRRI
ncbi:exo-rhamnogalacturonan lyase family protein [Duganella aceris]|uniref:exo-rhamnogalacturonan lyase family protein n=1 Tax=Duganella aceris TaxID=2703883 RepID=UPI001A9562BA|nr:DUF6250 domain-containing protein [Duganella aceris]